MEKKTRSMRINLIVVSGSQNGGFVWKKSRYDTKSLRIHLNASPCGWPLILLEHKELCLLKYLCKAFRPSFYPSVCLQHLLFSKNMLLLIISKTLNINSYYKHFSGYFIASQPNRAFNSSMKRPQVPFPEAA